MKRIVCIFVLVAITFSFYATYVNGETLKIFIRNDGSKYEESLKEAFSTMEFIDVPLNSELRHFVNGRDIVAYDTYAKYITAKVPEYTFASHYLQTSVIAINRDFTDAKIRGWKDLLASELKVSFFFGERLEDDAWASGYYNQILASMTMGIYGSYEIEKTIRNIEILKLQNRFMINEINSPALILQDHQAVELMKAGFNLEIIVPVEGTHSFARGILTDSSEVLEGKEINKALLENSFRLTNFQADREYYPPEEAYAKALPLVNTDAYNTAMADSEALFKRIVLDTERTGFGDNIELTFAYIIVSFIIIFYGVTVLNKVSHKQMKRALLAAVPLQILTITFNYLRSVFVDVDWVYTLFWYGFYISFILLPVALLYISIIAGHSEKNVRIPYFFKAHLIITGIILIFILTNDIHGQVFTLDPYAKTRDISFTYEWGYMLFMIWMYMTLFLAIGRLLYKSIRNPLKRSYVLPVIACVITLAYTIGYVLEIQIIRDIQPSYATVGLSFLHLAVCIKAKLIPLNRGYDKFFENSTLSMVIADKKEKPVYISKNMDEINDNHELREVVLPNGTLKFYEDNTALNEVSKELEETNRQLVKNNQILKAQYQVKVELASELAKKEVDDTINYLLTEGARKIEPLLEKLKETKDTKKLVAQINIIACGTKRLAMLKISTLKEKEHPISDLMKCIAEMDKFTRPLGINTTVGANLDGSRPSAELAYMYELFYLATEQMVLNESENILVQLYKRKGKVVFSITTETDVIGVISPHLKNNLKKAGGELSQKPWEDTNVISLSFPQDIKEGGKSL